MTVEIKKVLNPDFMALVALWVEMNEVLSEPIHAPAAVYNLVTDLPKRDFRCFGLYRDGVLSGFTAGYALSEKTYYFSGIYAPNSSKNVAGLIERSFAEIAHLGYTRWEADCNNENIASILKKYGAVPMYTRYKKED